MIPTINRPRGEGLVRAEIGQMLASRHQRADFVSQHLIAFARVAIPGPAVLVDRARFAPPSSVIADVSDVGKRFVAIVAAAKECGQ